MVHTFSVVHSKANYTIMFYDGDKQRHIKFRVGTKECELIKKAVQHYYACSQVQDYSGDKLYIAAINHLRKSYLFKSNPNNVSIFRPVAR